MKIVLALFLLFGLTALTNAQKITLTGTVYDEKGGRINQAKITLTDKDGNESTASASESGSYQIKLLSGIYKITFLANYFKPLIISNYLVVNTDSRKMYLDAVLEVATVVD